MNDWQVTIEAVAEGRRTRIINMTPHTILDARHDTSTLEATIDKMHEATGHVSPTPNAAGNIDMCVVGHIVPHINTKDSILYILRWYGYTAAESSVKPSDDIPEHFIKHSWSRLNCSLRTKRKCQWSTHHFLNLEKWEIEEVERTKIQKSVAFKRHWRTNDASDNLTKELWMDALRDVLRMKDDDYLYNGSLHPALSWWPMRTDL